MPRKIVRRIGGGEDFARGEQVGQPRYAAQVGATPKGEQKLGFGAEQAGHFLLLAGANGAVDEGRGDLQEAFAEVHDGFFAAAAGGAPVERHFRFIGHQCMTSSINSRDGAGAAGRRSGPRARTFATMSLMTERTLSPSEAEIHSRRKRSSSIPISRSRRFIRATRRRAL